MPSDKYLRPIEETAPLCSPQQYLKMPAFMTFFYPVTVKPCYLFHPETCYARQPESVSMSSGRSYLSQEKSPIPTEVRAVVCISISSTMRDCTLKL